MNITIGMIKASIISNFTYKKINKNNKKYILLFGKQFLLCYDVEKKKEKEYTSKWNIISNYRYLTYKDSCFQRSNVYGLSD